jgi:hypothetical protein
VQHHTQPVDESALQQASTISELSPRINLVLNVYRLQVDGFYVI